MSLILPALFLIHEWLRSEHHFISRLQQDACPCALMEVTAEVQAKGTRILCVIALSTGFHLLL